MGQKIIYLVRHGQYVFSQTTSDPLGGSLTDLGKEQAALVAQRLRQLPIDRIHYSTMNRAAETAEVIATEFPQVPVEASELLWEFRWGIFTDVTQDLDSEALQRVEQTKQRIETAFQQYFTPSLTEATQHEILVCHGNLISYFICRALQLPLEALLTMESANCGISTLSITPNGRLLLIGYSDVGHLPTAKQTYIRYVPASNQLYMNA